MGISTYQSYLTGAQIFDAVGMPNFCLKSFSREAASQILGIGIKRNLKTLIRSQPSLFQHGNIETYIRRLGNNY